MNRTKDIRIIKPRVMSSPIAFLLEPCEGAGDPFDILAWLLVQRHLLSLFLRVPQLLQVNPHSVLHRRRKDIHWEGICPQVDLPLAHGAFMVRKVPVPYSLNLRQRIVYFLD